MSMLCNSLKGFFQAGIFLSYQHQERDDRKAGEGSTVYRYHRERDGRNSLALQNITCNYK